MPRFSKKLKIKITTQTNLLDLLTSSCQCHKQRSRASQQNHEFLKALLNCQEDSYFANDITINFNTAKN